MTCKVKRSPKQIAVQRVLDAATQWHHQFSLAGPKGDFQAFQRAGKRLDLACKRLSKVSR